jgi:hypothetical protein
MELIAVLNAILLALALLFGADEAAKDAQRKQEKPAPGVYQYEQTDFGQGR